MFFRVFELPPLELLFHSSQGAIEIQCFYPINTLFTVFTYSYDSMNINPGRLIGGKGGHHANAFTCEDSSWRVQCGCPGRQRREENETDFEETKAEAVYFTEYDGQRGAIMIININDPAEVPKFAEPWFLSFNADVQFHIVMTPEELGRAGLEKLGKRWS